MANSSPKGSASRLFCVERRAAEFSQPGVARLPVRALDTARAPTAWRTWLTRFQRACGFAQSPGAAVAVMREGHDGERLAHVRQIDS